MTADSRRLLLPGAMTAVMLAVLLGLGTWQIQRMRWKEDLLARIALAEAAAARPLAGTPAAFALVSAAGTFLRDKVARYGAEVRQTAHGTTMGARMIVPFRRTNGQVILVDRGWAPSAGTASLDPPRGIVTVSGYARFADTAGWFSARDDLTAKRFYTLDPLVIAAALGEPDVPPFILVILDAGAAPFQWPEPARHLPRPPNNHLSYAMTWYGLAIALLAIFVVWARKGSRA